MPDHTIIPGLTLELEFEVMPEHSAAHIGSGTVGVLSTPSMIAFIEITARKLLDAQVPTGSSTVGTRVDVRHLAPTAVGCMVRVQTEVDAVDGRVVILAISAWEGEKQIGSGIHHRVVIDVARFLQKIQ